MVKTKESNIRLNYDSILFAELVQKSIIYHLLNGKRIESTSIRSSFSEAMQELLRDSRFALCGTSRVVNLHYIIELDGENLYFKNGAKIHIGRRAARELRSVWYDFWFNEEENK